MGIKSKFEVRQIVKQETYPWLLRKHYAKRIPSISYAFGLYEYDCGDLILKGVCTFGFPPNYMFNNGRCVFDGYECLTLELNRLVTDDDLEKNCLSYFVSQSLLNLPKPVCIVSYADPNNGHHGFIYQATNWYYTGVSTPKHEYTFSDGSTFDVRRGIDKKGDIVNKRLLKPTFRYLYFSGSKSDKKKMLKCLKMDIKPYPKGDNKTNDASFKPVTQGVLF